ncbi:MAG: 50S ribosomal protein L11 methyltransferase [Bacteroidetes bacterium]|nr:50S ribosomal protein L11 methyltransferase [Bacteroidota bacterium]MDA0938369.1 50S ribosomal protein L11 methyltransferase [Bacteroidota bacterium]MDA1344908.1 50S ribosomal protein L11 methyltransferase [Bacteroidota bacterium]
MALPYHAFIFEITPLEPAREILIAELATLGFESFEETETGLQAYIPITTNDPPILEDVSILKHPEFEIRYTYNRIEPENWNAIWERDFQKVYVGADCLVRAPFHNSENKAYEIVISPKMSFGTGHHETTSMMLAYLMETNCKALHVLDMGSGTGVLAILAEKRGAVKIDAIDIDPWCYENCQENTLLNACSKITAHQGTADDISGTYDIILANINRNILVEDLPKYVQSMAVDGQLFLSGFYQEDLPLIQKVASENGLVFDSYKENNKWVAAKFLYQP